MGPIQVESHPAIGGIESNQSVGSTSVPWSESIRIVLVGVLFCVSGLPALVYQIVWQRILALHSGVGIYSVAMIVSSFMAGLGIGSLVGGAISRRLSRRAALQSFAAIELAIGCFSAVSCWLYYDLLYLKFSWLYDNSWLAGSSHFIALLIPTALMGMSLPILVRAMVRDGGSAGRTIAFLYGVNVLGAALGAAITPWVLMRLWGIRGAANFGVACNVFVGLAAIAIGKLFPLPQNLERPNCTETDGDTLTGRVGGRVPFGVWVALYLSSGFVGLALEILWFRLCDVATKSTAYTFGTVLAVYLFGLSAGSLVGSAAVRRIKTPLRVFLLCQCFILTYSAGAVFLLGRVPTNFPGMRWLFGYWRGYDGLVLGAEMSSYHAWVFGVLPAGLFAIPTVLMGCSFAALQKAVQDAERTSGWRVGILQAANIAGCVAGSMLVGLALLTQLGTIGTLRLLLVMGLGFVAIGVFRGWRKLFLSLGGGMMALAIGLPGQEQFWLRLHGIENAASLLAAVREDATGVVAITPEPAGNLRLSVDGKGHSWLPYGTIHSYLGALPAVVHRQPEEIAIVGLGSGDTAWAAACRPETRRVKVFELCAPEKQLLQRLAATGRMPVLASFLNDPRIDIETADGRNALTRAGTKFDIIEADASRPQTAYSGNLYSVEFFRQCSDKLKPQGLMCTWSPTPRVHRTFCQAFPHVLEFNGGEVLLGSRDELRVESGEWLARLQVPAVTSYLGIPIARGVADYLQGGQPANPMRFSYLAPNSDLFARDEFLSPR